MGLCNNLGEVNIILVTNFDTQLFKLHHFYQHVHLLSSSAVTSSSVQSVQCSWQYDLKSHIEVFNSAIKLSFSVSCKKGHSCEAVLYSFGYSLSNTVNHLWLYWTVNSLTDASVLCLNIQLKMLVLGSHLAAPGAINSAEISTTCFFSLEVTDAQSQLVCLTVQHRTFIQKKKNQTVYKCGRREL